MNLTVEYRQSHLLSIKAHEYVAGSRLGPIQLRRSSLLYVNKGTGSLRFSSNSTIKLEPGTCLHFDGNNRFEWTIGNNVDLQATLVQYRTMTIRASGSDVSADWESEERQPRIESLLPSVAVQIGALIDRLKPLSLDCSNGGNLRKQILMDELQLLLFEHETATASPSSASDQDSLQITIDYMKQHYMKPLQIGALAQMAGLTPSSFCRAFKQLTDRTPGSYLTELRIDKAKQLMSDPNVKFKQISSVIGFQDELYFSRVFKKREGVSPTIYMKRNEKRIAIVSGLNLQDQLLALGIHPIAAPSFPAFYGTPSGFPVYLIDKLKRTIPINAERTVSSHEVTSLSPDLILKADFIRNENDDSWQLEGNTVFLKDQDNWESYQRDIALQLNKERELEKIVRQVKKAERYGERELASFTRRGRWTIVRLLPGDCRIYGQTGHAFTDLFYRDLKFQPDGGLEYRSYKSHTLASLVELDPDNVLIIWSDPDTVASYKEDPLWQELRAAKENRVYYPNSKQWDPWGPIGRQYMIKELTGYFLSLA